MARVAHLFNRAENSELLVMAKRRFVISDDLMIKSASTGSTHFLLQRIDSGGVGQTFEEVEVCVGWAEVVSMLKATLSSKNVLTDIFLRKETDRCVRAAVNLSPGQNAQCPSNEETDSSPQFNIKVFYDRKQKKVMYAEFEHEVVDLLLSFLVYPVACLIKNLAGTSRLVCSLDNLYGSAIDLHANGLLAGHGQTYALYRETLLDPSITPFDVNHSGKRDVKKWFCLCRITRVPNCQCMNRSLPCPGCSPQFVNVGTYVVEDDLLIYQASAMLVMKYWCKREKDAVLEMDIAITKQEAVDLLRAALTSETALTNVFRSRLEDKCQQLPSLQQKRFQIFVKLYTGKTITLDVEGHDTIATVNTRSMIKSDSSLQSAIE